MTTASPAPKPAAPAAETPQTPARRWPVPQRVGGILALVGALVVVASGFMSWSYTSDVLGDLSIDGYPGAIQLLAMALALLAFLAVGTATLRGHAAGSRLGRALPWLDVVAGLHALAIGLLAYVVAVLTLVAAQSGGLINVNPGGWAALLGALLLVAGGLGVPRRPTKDALRTRTAAWAGILTITLLMAFVLFGTAYLLGIDDGSIFVTVLLGAAVLVWALTRTRFFTWLGLVAATHRRVLTLGAFAVAFLFPFTQDGSDANMSIATSVLIFATTALGLNIVVGLAGLLDLGYIAFLGAGAYVGATLSASTFATIDWKPPFIVVMLIGAAVSATLGLVIGSPTLRVSGDYLAIVTLAFGEIFRLTMNNLDGNNGPDLTNGPNGVPAIPDLQIGSFNLGEPHVVAGITLGRFANYYFLLLLLAAFIILVFTRLNNSRIGRGWVAIREDEKAAEAMGVNVFGLKLFAFASGAALAGLAGTIKAHQDVSVTPDQYVFLESAFLLAAIVLGGMGTVAGVLVGATILKLLPEKLRFVSDYRLLLFGLLLVLMMRFRPEGLVASQRRKLEFHEEDEGLADRLEEVHLVEEAKTA